MIMFKLIPVKSTLAFGFVFAPLSLFAWNFLLGSVVAQKEAVAPNGLKSVCSVSHGIEKAVNLKEEYECKYQE